MNFGLGAGSHTWRRMSVRERFDAQTMPVTESGCLLWVGSKTVGGYGTFHFNGAHSLAHRLAFIWAKGEIPKGLEIDHLCRVRCCVNPAHLEAVTRAINLNRGIGVTAQNHRKTHCIHGHEFSNGSRRGKPIRICKTCKLAWQRRNRDGK